ncbi:MULTISPECIES: response regulator [Caballeronia]|jgi:CheY-like chemotaxis protein|uniref:Histidine kinase n=1 Tax=Caballeronia zhejiangensis TaxID=871203 RepID=A0A656QEJ5_9BURK|nr:MULTISPECIES: response regulator [Caballeronia]EKS67754.1 response regulator receiver protein [Burkholderia sp. SJ98]KDR26959.1 histidine kinase [Caballeronia zhejiangensis]MCG7405427.1 response regulator [Caballeronia zhejiangensis]MCI1047529.1 response regulator [Caballeronia zhejiangensis]MDR5765217.1 response regulator [Caballeronia sp. LZ028]
MEERSYDLCTDRCEIWNPLTMALASPRRVLIVHSESNVGDSFALLLAMRGFEAVQIGDAAAASQFIRNWRPQVLFVDTLIGDAHDHAPARTLREALTVDRTEGEVELLIALAADAKQDPRDALHAAGYDGFCRTPCPVWWMFDVLKCFYVH